MKNKINILIHTNLETIDWTIGKQILEAFVERGEKLTPQTLWSFEKKVADFTNIQDIEPHWARLVVTKGTKDNYYYSEHHTGLTWKRRRKLKHETGMQHTSRDNRNNLCAGYFSFRGSYDASVDWEALFDDLTSILQSEKAFIEMHNENEPELSSLVYQGKLDDLPNISIVPKIVNFGPTKKLTLIDSELASKISKNGFHIESQSNAYKIKIFDNFHEVAEDHSKYVRRKAVLKSLFPENIFNVRAKPLEPKIQI